MAKVVIPRNPKMLLELVQKISEKHQADGANSPLTPVMPDGFQQIVTEGLQLNNKAEELEKEIEITYQKRDVIVKQASELARRVRDLLKGIHRNNLKQLGDYGFEVND